MSKFLNKLNVSHVTSAKGERRVVLVTGFRYWSSLLQKQVVVPRGFTSDGASVPKVLWWMYHPYGKYLEAAVIHDYFCVTHAVDSVTAARVFREAMEVCGVSAWRRRKMYLAVRWFGPRFEAATGN